MLTKVKPLMMEMELVSELLVDLNHLIVLVD